MWLTSKRAFTLIELLVVVLIIGILSAIALPMYENAVRKSRVAEAMVVLKQFTDAQDIYFLSSEDTGDYSMDFWNNVLDIKIPESTKNWVFFNDTCTFTTPPYCSNGATPQWESGYHIYYLNARHIQPTYAGHFICADDEKICSKLGKLPSSELDDYEGGWYIIQ